MKKRVILKVSVIVTILLLIALFTAINIHVFRNLKLPDSGAECYKDSDCAKVQTSCCSCNSGGEERCVSKPEAAIFENKLKNCSSDNFCAQVYNCNTERCVCREGKCAS